ncbi:MAG: FAD-dependent oxidoreductase, partial [Mycoplasmatota bacterium]
AKVYDLKIINDEVVELKKEEQFIIKTKKDTYKSLSVIIATGLAKRKLGLNEARFSNVSYCATCDGFFYKNKDVAIVGGGNTALEDAIFLSNICNKIYIINRSDKLRADDKLINQVKNNDNIKILYNSVIEKINGDKTITSITIDSKEIAIEGLFIAIGQIPQNQFLNNFVDLENGYVLSSDCKTNVNGLFVAGDCRTKEVRQLVTAASDGAISAVKAFEYIKTL